jgi:hypothetical protein
VRTDEYHRRLGVLRAFSRQVDGQFTQKSFPFLDTAMKQVNVAEKVVNEGIGRMMVDFFRSAHLLDAAFVH